MKLGAEAEFLALDHRGNPFTLVGFILSAPDIIGVDGHEETVEIRSEPGGSAKEVFESVSKRVALYESVITTAQLNRKLPNNLTRMRAGAYYVTNLGIHINFSGLSPNAIEPLVVTMGEVLLNKLLHRCVSATELVSRNNAMSQAIPHGVIRVKGEGSWFEWRQPYSCLTPIHFAGLLLGAEIFARLAEVNLPALKRLAKREDNEEHHIKALQRLAIDEPYLKKECVTFLKMREKILALGKFDWSKDVLPEWCH